ncbi:MAG: hypothetical protein E7478_00320 [Ruminococcaceae bacterium]|nr:hypothetical protein [Oscillospiraceae bacterium]
MKRDLKVITIVAIIAVAFTAILLIIPFEKSAISWIGYAFEMVALVMQLVFMKLAFKDGTIELKSKVYGYPIFRVGYIYLGIQTAVSVICLVVGAFLDDGEGWWIVMVVEIIILSAAAIGLIGSVEARQMVEEAEVRVMVDTSFIDGLKIDMTSLKDMCAGKACGSTVEKLYETVRYSDPVSVPELKAVEESIRNAVMQLRTSAMEGNDDSVIQQCANITMLMNDRNMRVKSLKK